MLASLSCPECFENNLYLEEDEIKKKKGRASYISIVCNRRFVKEGYTSKIVVDESRTAKKGMKPFEVNARIVYVLRTCLGYTALEKLCCIMNMPKPMTVPNFDKITNKTRDSAKVVAEISILEIKLVTLVLKHISSKYSPSNEIWAPLLRWQSAVAMDIFLCNFSFYHDGLPYLHIVCKPHSHTIPPPP